MFGVLWTGKQKSQIIIMRIMKYTFVCIYIYKWCVRDWVFCSLQHQFSKWGVRKPKWTASECPFAQLQFLNKVQLKIWQSKQWWTKGDQTNTQSLWSTCNTALWLQCVALQTQLNQTNKIKVNRWRRSFTDTDLLTEKTILPIEL